MAGVLALAFAQFNPSEIVQIGEAIREEAQNVEHEVEEYVKEEI